MPFSQPPQPLAAQFRSHWQASTADSNLTLHGFRRFKTTHLLNLRYLEAEIAELDHLLYQVSLSLDLGPSERKRPARREENKDVIDVWYLDPDFEVEGIVTNKTLHNFTSPLRDT
ncbi:hypothetical protein ACCO45_000032 [Purpureocillium lilacinum]|uniref:Uncharacterized protein n=1 Tax=Purpureocillium lilacinum TaxID=33203 RepID=A0ACC4EBS0_PURLI